MMRPYLTSRPAIKKFLKGYDLRLARTQHSIARWVPSIIHPEPRHLTIAVTAHCNLRCLGCSYGRDFMRGHQLPFEIVCQALDDARDGGINKVRFYGGEPLLHRNLARMVSHSIKNGFDTYVNTNGTLLRHKIDELYAAGLRLFTGFYGVGDRHSLYTQRGNSFHCLEAAIQSFSMVLQMCKSLVRFDCICKCHLSGN